MKQRPGVVAGLGTGHTTTLSLSPASQPATIQHYLLLRAGRPTEGGWWCLPARPALALIEVVPGSGECGGPGGRAEAGTSSPPSQQILIEVLVVVPAPVLPPSYVDKRQERLDLDYFIYSINMRKHTSTHTALNTRSSRSRELYN